MEYMFSQDQIKKTLFTLTLIRNQVRNSILDGTEPASDKILNQITLCDECMGYIESVVFGQRASNPVDIELLKKQAVV